MEVEALCPEDGAAFCDEKSIFHHRKTKHAEAEGGIISCALCPKKFSNQKNFSRSGSTYKFMNIEQKMECLHAELNALESNRKKT